MGEAQPVRARLLLGGLIPTGRARFSNVKSTAGAAHSPGILPPVPESALERSRMPPQVVWPIQRRLSIGS